MIYFTADTHFGHGGALGLFQRPFADVANMDSELEKLWNETVGHDDEVWHLGDVAVVPRNPVRAASFTEDLFARLSRLRGRKHLVTGNNDGEAVKSWGGWTSVQPYAEMAIGTASLVLCHYPLRSWNGMNKRSVNLHGHSHGRLSPMPRQFDVGVDARQFRPVVLAQLQHKSPAR